MGKREFLQIQHLAQLRLDEANLEHSNLFSIIILIQIFKNKISKEMTRYFLKSTPSMKAPVVHVGFSPPLFYSDSINSSLGSTLGHPNFSVKTSWLFASSFQTLSSKRVIPIFLLELFLTLTLQEVSFWCAFIC